MIPSRNTLSTVSDLEWTCGLEDDLYRGKPRLERQSAFEAILKGVLIEVYSGGR